MNKLLNQFGETIKLLDDIKTIIKEINNIDRSKRIEITKLEIINELKNLDKLLIESKKYN